jgi:hypothetical protein
MSLIDGNTAPTGGDSPRETDDTDSIRSSLASALASAEAPETPEPEKAASEPPEAVDEASTSTRKRGPDGKFAKEDGEPEPEVTDPAAVDPNAAPVDPNAVPDPAAVVEQAAQPPVTLSKEDQEAYKKLPPEAQKMVAAVVKRQDAEFTRKTQAIAALKNEYEPVSKIFEPYRDQMRQAGFTPRTIIEAWANVEQRLMHGEGVDVIKSLVQNYKIDPAKLADAIGIQRGAAPAQTEQTPQFYVDPASGQLVQQPPQYQPQELEALVKQRLEQALGPIHQRLAAEDQQRAQQQRQQQIERENRVSTEIDQFQNSQDDKGNLQHPHFEEVEAQMTALAQAAIASRQPVPPLKELYETAVWANPSTRAKEIAARETAQREKASAEARAKAAAAKKAGSSVTGAPGAGQTQVASKSQSLREQLEEAAADAA